MYKLLQIAIRHQRAAVSSGWAHATSVYIFSVMPKRSSAGTCSARLNLLLFSKQHCKTSLPSPKQFRVILKRKNTIRKRTKHAFHLTSNSFILLDVTYKPIPMGMKIRPITKKAGSTVPAVRMGCQAGSLCCLKAVLSGFLLLATPLPAAPDAPGWWPSSSFALYPDAIMAALLYVFDRRNKQLVSLLSAWLVSERCSADLIRRQQPQTFSANKHPSLNAPTAWDQQRRGGWATQRHYNACAPYRPPSFTICTSPNKQTISNLIIYCIVDFRLYLIYTFYIKIIQAFNACK